jgi:hypothetical protein
MERAALAPASGDVDRAEIGDHVEPEEMRNAS